MNNLGNILDNREYLAHSHRKEEIWSDIKGSYVHFQCHISR